MGESNSSVAMLRKLLDEISKEEGFSDYEIKNGDGSNRGDGYTSATESIQVKSKNDRNSKTLNLFVKSAPSNEVLREKVKFNYMFKREIFIYGTVLPTFKDLELKNGLEPSLFGPMMYNGCTEDKSEILILENLKENGYKLHDCSKPLNEDHVSFVMKAYGRFHALSYALRSLEPETFSKFEQILDYEIVTIMKTGEFVKNTFVTKCQSIYDSLTKSNVDQKVLEVYKTFVDTLEDEYMEFATAIDSYAVILHGDCWPNNMMFKYEDEEDTSEPTAVRFFDYQLSRMGSPVLDLSYFFYTSSSKEIIDNWEHYLSLYHSSLALHLEQLGCNVDDLFPYEVLMSHWRKFARYGFMFTALVMFITLTKKDEIVTFEETVNPEDGVTKAFNYEIANGDQYFDRMRHITMHFVENNLF